MTKEVSFLIKIRDDGGAKRVTANAEEMGRVIRSVQDEAERLKRDVLTWSEAAQAVDVLQSSISELQAALTEMTADYQTSVVAQTQLATIMRQRMGSTEEEIQSIRDLCSAQQELGVVEDDIAASGAQQMATFLKQKESLDVLIPAMNNLIAQQDGLNATVQGAVSIGNMMGKAMQGQTAVLQRVGITFDEAQARVLQYGTESERAAMLAEVITANVGNMNAELAKTDAGKQKQLENTLGDIKEKLGSMVQGAMPFITITAQAMICVAGCVKLITSLRALSAAFSLTAIKGTVLAAHERVVAAAQAILATSGYTAAGGTVALALAVTALYTALTMGLSVVITAVIGLFSSMGDEAEDASEGVDHLKESEDAFSQTSSNVRAELDLEISRLASLIHNHENASKKVSELNKKYGESFGYHRTAAEWYDTLIEKSKVYCAQMGYEAQAKVLSSQIAAAQLEKEGKENERRKLGQQYMDSKGAVHYNWENTKDGKDYYTKLGSDINDITSKINGLQKQYDSAIRHMVDAQQQLDRARKSTRLTGSGSLRDSTTEELKQAIEEKQGEVSRLKGDATAERQRLNREIGRMQKEVNWRDAINKREQGLSVGEKAGITTENEKPVKVVKTLDDVAKNVAYYEAQLKKTDKADTEKIQKLSRLIAKYKELGATIQTEIAEAQRPKELDSLEKIDAEIQRQEQLRKKAGKEQLSVIDSEIKRLNTLRTAFEDSSHVDLLRDEITTYDQLEGEIVFYTKKLKTATDSERVEIQKQINALNDLKKKWDETLADLKAPEDIGRLNTIEKLDEAVAYYQAKQKKASGAEISAIGETITALERKREALTRLPKLRAETTKLNGLGQKELKLELKVMGLDGIKKRIKELQGMLADTKNPLDASQRAEVEKLIGSYDDYARVLQKSDARLEDLWGNTKSIVGGISSMRNALENGRGAWETLMSVVDGVIQTFQGIMNVVEIVKALTGATQMSAAAGQVKAATTASETAATTTHTAATAADTAAAITNTSAKSGEAIAGATASGARMPFPLNIVAIAAGVAAVVAALASISGSGFANGGIVGGSSPSGDKLLARVNSGEMILNGAQQSRLFRFINGVTPFADGGLVYGPTLSIMGEYAGARSNPEVIAPLNKLKSLIGEGAGGSGRLVGRVRGRDIVLAMANETRINRRKTNIKL